jgi:hypothetical protein
VSVIIRTGSRWVHRKTKRPIKVTDGNAPRPEYVMGVVVGDKPGSTVWYVYTDRTTRVMPQTSAVEKFLATFKEHP